VSKNEWYVRVWLEFLRRRYLLYIGTSTAQRVRLNDIRLIDDDQDDVLTERLMSARCVILKYLYN
jgi:uncharacterized protein YnzC (UPF0291/DUF896 family)